MNEQMLEWAADRPDSFTEIANGLWYAVQMGALATSAGTQAELQKHAAASLAAYATAPVSLPKTGTLKRSVKGRKGFREVRKTDGPPTGPPSGYTTPPTRFARRSWFEGDRVRDRKGVAYVCVNAKGNGGAGQWERET